MPAIVKGLAIDGRGREELVEHADMVVIGARLAGCAVAAPLARAGRRVIVLDKMSFPSDQLSTHVLLPAGTSERILELLSKAMAIRKICQRIVRGKMTNSILVAATFGDILVGCHPATTLYRATANGNAAAVAQDFNGISRQRAHIRAPLAVVFSRVAGV